MTKKLDLPYKNPAGNKLKSEITKEQINEAIKKSGYPLQLKVAEELEKKFFIQHEWSYIDSSSEELRTTDILAEIDFWRSLPKQPRVRPQISLLIECKQSDLPIVFFLSKHPLIVPNFPLLAGLFKDEIEIKTDDDRSTWTESILHVLDFHKDKFILNEPMFSITFSRAERKGDRLELSGDWSFNAITSPLMKAIKFFKKVEEPPKTAFYFDLHLIIGLAIIDAPLFGVFLEGDSHDLNPLPWFRVIRHENHKELGWQHRNQIYAIDIIHKDFLTSYIENHLLAFGDRFAKIVLNHQKEIAEGKGFISGMGKNSWNNLENRLKPR